MAYAKHIFRRRRADGEITNTGIVQNSFCLFLEVVGYLDYHCGILGKENLHQIVLSVHFKAVGIEVDASTCIGEAHLQKSCHQTACAYIVCRAQHAFCNQLLHSSECFHKSIRIGNIRSDIANTAQRLGKCRTSQLHRCRTEVDIVETGFPDCCRQPALLCA